MHAYHDKLSTLLCMVSSGIDLQAFVVRSVNRSHRATVAGFQVVS